MNKEEVKLSILKQFREDDSAIRTLMMVTYPGNLYSGDTYFKKDGMFYSQPLELMMHVRHLCNQAGQQSFQISFEDVVESPPNHPYIEPLDIVGYQVRPTVYTVEEVHFVDDRIHFWLSQFQLAENDSVYIVINKNDILMATFSLKTGLLTSQGEILKWTTKLNKMMSGRHYGHIRYLYDANEHQCLLKFLKDNKSNEKLSKEIVKCFHGSQFNRQGSPTAYILNKLVLQEIGVI